MACYVGRVIVGHDGRPGVGHLGLGGQVISLGQLDDAAIDRISRTRAVKCDVCSRPMLNLDHRLETMHLVSRTCPTCEEWAATKIQKINRARRAWSLGLKVLNLIGG